MDDIQHNNVYQVDTDGLESYNDEDDGGEGVYDGNMCDVMDDGVRVRCQVQGPVQYQGQETWRLSHSVLCQDCYDHYQSSQSQSTSPRIGSRHGVISAKQYYFFLI